MSQLLAMSTDNLTHWHLIYLGHAKIQHRIFQPITQVQLTAWHVWYPGHTTRKVLDKSISTNHEGNGVILEQTRCENYYE
jgi:hypothetical protein